mgnify:CR=1 FL=1
MTLHIANKMDEVEASVWWDFSCFVRFFEPEGMNRKNAKRAVLNAVLRLVNDESSMTEPPFEDHSVDVQ